MPVPGIGVANVWDWCTQAGVCSARPAMQALACFGDQNFVCPLSLAALSPDLLISLHALPGPCPCTADAAWAPAARCMLQSNALRDRLAGA